MGLEDDPIEEKPIEVKPAPKIVPVIEQPPIDDGQLRMKIIPSAPNNY